MPLVIDCESPPAGKPYARTASLMAGSVVARGMGAWVLKKLSSSSFRMARSMPGAMNSTRAAILSPASLPWIWISPAYRATCALVNMRLPSITTPEPVTLDGDCLFHGLKGSGLTRVAKIFTTEPDSALLASDSTASAAMLSTGMAAAHTSSSARKVA